MQAWERDEPGRERRRPHSGGGRAVGTAPEVRERTARHEARQRDADTTEGGWAGPSIAEFKESREVASSAKHIPGAAAPPGASRGNPDRPASAGDQRSAHKRRPRRYIGLRPRKIHPPVDGAPILGPGGLTSQSLQPEGSCNPLLGNAPGTFS
jgi:hypothetical protein